MTRNVLLLLRDARAAAAAEMALVLPFLLILMFGSMELGHYFYQEHVVVKKVRDGARYASRMTLSGDYVCSADPDEVFFDDPDDGVTPKTVITNVTRTGRVDASGPERVGTEPCGDDPAYDVAIRCVSSDDYKGIYTGLDGEVPVVKVSASLRYASLFGALGFDATNLCLAAESEIPVAGL